MKRCGLVATLGGCLRSHDRHVEGAQHPCLPMLAELYALSFQLMHVFCSHAELVDLQQSARTVRDFAPPANTFVSCWQEAASRQWLQYGHRQAQRYSSVGGYSRMEHFCFSAKTSAFLEIMNSNALQASSVPKSHPP